MKLAPYQRRMLIYLASAVFLHHTALWTVQRRLLFPGAFMELGGHPRHPELVRLSVEHDEGSTFGYLKLADEAMSPAAEAPLVVFAHGNAEIAADWVFELEPYTSRGMNVLAVEYRGFGASDGSPSQKGFHSDILALIEAAGKVPGVDASRVVYHGRSVGGGVLGSLAATHPPAALILESTFSSVHSMSSAYLAPRYLVRDPLDVHRALAQSYDGPVLLLHSRVDEVIPFAQFERNRAAAEGRGESLTAVEIHGSLGHNDTWQQADPHPLAPVAPHAFHPGRQ